MKDITSTTTLKIKTYKHPQDLKEAIFGAQKPSVINQVLQENYWLTPQLLEVLELYINKFGLVGVKHLVDVLRFIKVRYNMKNLPIRLARVMLSYDSSAHTSCSLIRWYQPFIHEEEIIKNIGIHSNSDYDAAINMLKEISQNPVYFPYHFENVMNILVMSSTTHIRQIFEFLIDMSITDIKLDNLVDLLVDKADSHKLLSIIDLIGVIDPLSKNIVEKIVTYFPEDLMEPCFTYLRSTNTTILDDQYRLCIRVICSSCSQKEFPKLLDYLHGLYGLNHWPSYIFEELTQNKRIPPHEYITPQRGVTYYKSLVYHLPWMIPIFISDGIDEKYLRRIMNRMLLTRQLLNLTPSEHGRLIVACNAFIDQETHNPLKLRLAASLDLRYTYPYENFFDSLQSFPCDETSSLLITRRLSSLQIDTINNPYFIVRLMMSISRADFFEFLESTYIYNLSHNNKMTILHELIDKNIHEFCYHFSRNPSLFISLFKITFDVYSTLRKKCFERLTLWEKINIQIIFTFSKKPSLPLAAVRFSKAALTR